MSWGPRLRPHAGPLALAALAALLTAAVPAATVWLLREAIDALTLGDPGGVTMHVVLLVGLTAGALVVRTARTALTKGVAWRLAADLRTALHRRWLAEGVGDAATGDRLSALTQEVDQVQYGVSGAVTLTRDPLTLVGLAAVALVAAPALAPWVVLAALPVIAVAAWTARWVSRATVDVRQRRAALSALATEQLDGWEVIDLFGAHRREAERFAAFADADRRARWHLDVVRGIPAAAAQLAALAGAGVLMVVGARAVAVGEQDAAGLAALTAAVGLALRPLGRLSEGWALLQRATAALARVEAELALPVPVYDDGATEHDGPLGVHLDGAEFWDGARRVLGPVHLEVAPGEVVALVGRTGAGKTTLLRLVAGAHVPTRGAVRVGGWAPAGASPEARAARVATMPQDGFLFARTVAANVRLGAPEAKDEQVWEALGAASARFVAHEGLHRELGPAGAPLSGGERQRLGLARALVTQASVLLLDEPTNQVDGATEAAIVDAVRALRGRRTVLVASHDKRVAMAADRIVVLEAGRVVQVGTPEQLIASSGPFQAVMGAA